MADRLTDSPKSPQSLDRLLDSIVGVPDNKPLQLPTQATQVLPAVRAVAIGGPQHGKLFPATTALRGYRLVQFNNPDMGGHRMLVFRATQPSAGLHGWEWADTNERCAAMLGALFDPAVEGERRVEELRRQLIGPRGAS